MKVVDDNPGKILGLGHIIGRVGRVFVSRKTPMVAIPTEFGASNLCFNPESGTLSYWKDVDTGGGYIEHPNATLFLSGRKEIL